MYVQYYYNFDISTPTKLQYCQNKMMVTFRAAAIYRYRYRISIISTIFQYRYRYRYRDIDWKNIDNFDIEKKPEKWAISPFFSIFWQVFNWYKTFSFSKAEVIVRLLQKLIYSHFWHFKRNKCESESRKLSENISLH